MSLTSYRAAPPRDQGEDECQPCVRLARAISVSFGGYCCPDFWASLSRRSFCGLKSERKETILDSACSRACFSIGLKSSTCDVDASSYSLLNALGTLLLLTSAVRLLIHSLQPACKDSCQSSGTSTGCFINDLLKALARLLFIVD